MIIEVLGIATTFYFLGVISHFYMDISRCYKNSSFYASMCVCGILFAFMIGLMTGAVTREAAYEQSYKECMENKNVN